MDINTTKKWQIQVFLTDTEETAEGTIEYNFIGSDGLDIDETNLEVHLNDGHTLNDAEVDNIKDAICNLMFDYGKLGNGNLFNRSENEILLFKAIPKSLNVPSPEYDVIFEDSGILSETEVIERISESLKGLSGKELANLHNDLCHGTLDYQGDSIWTLEE